MVLWRGDLAGAEGLAGGAGGGAQEGESQAGRVMLLMWSACWAAGKTPQSGPSSSCSRLVNFAEFW